MSDPIDADVVQADGTPASDPTLRAELPCGCVRAVVKRKVPLFVDAPGTPEHGTPKLNDAGEITFQEGESIEESYCAKHSQTIIARQEAVAKALAAGDQAGALALMAGASPFPQLGDGSEDE
jgi:hypothetical protein